MKRREILISFIFIAILTQAVGTVLNHIVVYLNGGMPVKGLAITLGKWPTLNQETKLPLLADIIRINTYILSVGDLFMIAGIVTCLIAIWIAMPQSRKLFPLLITSVFGFFLSIARLNNRTLTVLCEIAVAGTILAMY